MHTLTKFWQKSPEEQKKNHVTWHNAAGRERQGNVKKAKPETGRRGAAIHQTHPTYVPSDMSPA